MRIKPFILLFLGLISLNLKAQHKNQTEQLSTLCKTWGLLKYYHPEIAKGTHNWDWVLVSSLNNLLTLKADSQFINAKYD